MLIEDTAEITIEARNLVRLEARRAQLDTPEVSIRSCCGTRCGCGRTGSSWARSAGAEAFDLLQALNTGHTGTL